MVSPGTEVPSVPEGGSWAQQVAREGCGGTGRQRESVLQDQLWLWVLAVVGAIPDRGAPWGPGRAIDILGARGALLRWRFLAVRFRGVTQKQLRFRVIQNGFRPPRSSWRPPHLHCRFYASAASMPRGLRGSTPFVPRSSYPLIPGPAPWCFSLPRPALPRLHCPLPPSVR